VVVQKIYVHCALGKESFMLAPNLLLHMLRRLFKEKPTRDPPKGVEMWLGTEKTSNQLEKSRNKK
jgi:hypothetical protein